MFFAKPSEGSIRAFLAAQEKKGFSYEQVGASRGEAPRGYIVDHHRTRLGSGSDAFERAADALRHWKMFELPWLNLCLPTTPIEPGTTVAVLVAHFGLWSLNACRIVYAIEEHSSWERYGFACGTLAGHAEAGQERFTVEFDHEDGSVWYDVYAFSRPNRLARLVYPVSRALQKRFARDSQKAMQQAVALIR